MGIAVPSTAILIEIAQLFHVSTDFLLGLQDTATLDVSELNDSEILLLEKLASYFRSTRNV